jgi:sodium-dependent dicarboxylate transporter 2/3/5
MWSARVTEAKAATIDRKVLWLGFALLLGLILWFMPSPSGLTVAGRHALAVVIFTVILWVSGAVPAGVGSLLMIGIVICLMPKEVDSGKFLSFWTQDTMWFVLVCFMFGAVMQKSGLGNRLATYVFSIRSLFLLDLAVFGLNIIFLVVGMAASFPKIVLLMPLVVSIATLSGMSKKDPYVRHVALMINALANQTGVMLYSGYVMNPALGPLGGFQVNFVTWIQWFFVPALALNLATFFVLYFLFFPRQSNAKGFDQEIIREKRRELGTVKKDEIKAIIWLALAIILWATSNQTGIQTGYAAVLVAAMLMLPGVGMIKLKEFVDTTDWNTVFMLMGVLSVGTLGATGFAKWLWGIILPNQMPGNHMLVLIIISFLVEILHIPLGSIGTTQALAVPSLAAYGATLGMSRMLLSIVAYLSIVGQFFFVYQNAALVAGQGFKLWDPKDIVKFGSVMFFVTPLVVGVILYPWWMYMGWIH